MLKHALPCQWNSIHFSFSTRWGWFNAYFSIVWLNQGMLLQNTLKQTNKKRLSHTEMQTQTGKENYYFTCIDGSSEYIDGFYRNEPCGRQRRRLRLEQSLQPGTWNINYYNSIILVKRTNLRPLNGMSGAGSASFLPIFVFSDRKKLQNFRFISKMKIDNSWLYVETDESVCIVADFGIKTTLKTMIADVYSSNTTIRNFMIISFSHDLDQPANWRGHTSVSVDEYLKTGPMWQENSIITVAGIFVSRRSPFSR